MLTGDNYIDETGQKYGHLTVIGKVRPEPSADGRCPARWRVKCDCGRTFVVTGTALRAGFFTACRDCESRYAH